MNEKINLTVCIIARDEARWIQKCLRSLDWASEILVIDTGSKDDTASLANSMGARVIPFSPSQPDGCSIGEAKKIAVQKAKHDWLLFLDADEEVLLFDDLALYKVLANANPSIYNLQVQYHFKSFESNTVYLWSQPRLINRQENPHLQFQSSPCQPLLKPEQSINLDNELIYVKNTGFLFPNLPKRPFFKANLKKSEEAYTKNPNQSLDLTLYLAFHYLAAEKPKKALDSLLQAIDSRQNLPSDSDEAGSLYQIISLSLEILWTLQRTSELEKNLDLWQTKFPKGGDILYHQGLLALKVNNVNSAIGFFQQCINASLPPQIFNLGASSYLPMTQISACLIRMGRIDDAREILEQVWRLWRRPNPEVYLNLAQISLAQHKLENALRHFERALKIDPHFRLAHICRGELLLISGQTDEAAESLEKSCRIFPRDSNLHNLLAKSLFRQKNYSTCEEITEKVIAISGSPGSLSGNDAAFNELMLTEGVLLKAICLVLSGKTKDAKSFIYQIFSGPQLPLVCLLFSYLFCEDETINTSSKITENYAQGISTLVEIIIIAAQHSQLLQLLQLADREAENYPLLLPPLLDTLLLYGLRDQAKNLQKNLQKKDLPTGVENTIAAIMG